jgi:methanethiol S-methyltransferase
MRYFFVLALWAAYCAVHSVLITTAFTEACKRLLRTHYRYYRLFYCAFSLATLIPLMEFSKTVATRPVFHWPGALIALKYSMLAGGALLFIAGFWRYDILEFLGLRQLRQQTTPAGSEYGKLDTSGILGVIRHPLYAGLLLMLWSENQDTFNVAINLILTVYIFIGTWLEEKKLTLALGDDYRRYQQAVSMYIPMRWLRSKCMTGSAPNRT